MTGFKTRVIRATLTALLFCGCLVGIVHGQLTSPTEDNVFTINLEDGLNTQWQLPFTVIETTEGLSVTTANTDNLRPGDLITYVLGPAESFLPTKTRKELWKGISKAVTEAGTKTVKIYRLAASLAVPLCYEDAIQANSEETTSMAQETVTDTQE